MLNFYFIFKLFLILYVWVLIAFCVLFLLKSRGIYLRLKEYEKFCISKRREAVHYLVPVMFDISNLSKRVQSFLNLNQSSFSSIFKSFGFFQGIRYGLSLTRRLLK